MQKGKSKITYGVIMYVVLFISGTINCIAQTNKGLSGEFTYQYTNGTYFYRETLVLHKNGSFIYENIKHLGGTEKVFGNWQQRSDTIVLDSHPQRDRMIVEEFSRKKMKGFYISVLDKQKKPIHYSMYAITRQNDTLILQNQWKYSYLKKQIQSFYIIDSKGLKSPFYSVKGINSNTLQVYFETIKIFENESWLFQNDSIIPRNYQGDFQKYSLTKKPSEKAWRRRGVACTFAQIK